MNDTDIKNYAMWARRELISDVQKRCMRYGILQEGSLPANADGYNDNNYPYPKQCLVSGVYFTGQSYQQIIKNYTAYPG